MSNSKSKSKPNPQLIGTKTEVRKQGGGTRKPQNRPPVKPKK